MEKIHNITLLYFVHRCFSHIWQKCDAERETLVARMDRVPVSHSSRYSVHTVYIVECQEKHGKGYRDREKHWN